MDKQTSHTAHNLRSVYFITPLSYIAGLNGTILKNNQWRQCLGQPCEHSTMSLKCCIFYRMQPTGCVSGASGTVLKTN